MKEITYHQLLDMYKSKPAGIKALEKYHHWFPWRPSSGMAGIVGDLFGDGHLQGPQKWRMDYTSASLEELERFNTEIKKLFGVSGRTRPCTTNRYGVTFNLGINCKPLGRLLFLCGVPSGQKVLKEFTIPVWVLENKENFRRFLQRLFDCEAVVDTYSKAVELSMYKELGVLENGLQFFEEIKANMLKYFDIQTTRVFLGNKNKRKDGLVTQGIRMKVKRRSEIMKFAKEINFETPAKRQKLNQLVERFAIKN